MRKFLDLLLIDGCLEFEVKHLKSLDLRKASLLIFA